MLRSLLRLVLRRNDNIIPKLHSPGGRADIDGKIGEIARQRQGGPVVFLNMIFISNVTIFDVT
jgi:hypothetical protein